MGIACHKQLRKIRYFSLGVYVYYILKPKEIHLLPQSKVYLLVPENLHGCTVHQQHQFLYCPTNAPNHINCMLLKNTLKM